jgi:hypothetical protein
VESTRYARRAAAQATAPVATVVATVR